MPPNPHKRRSSSRGLWVAFLGPDGVGKSAVIDRLPESLDDEFSGRTRFHFRPRLCLGKRERRPITAPHAQVPRGAFLSYCKLIYWLLDCWLGYLFLVLPALRRSGLVVFDRYLPDLLVDPVRYRMPASAGESAAKLVSLAPQPDLYVLLDAPAEQVRRRKQEVSFAESQRQRAAYLTLFRSLPRTLVVNADSPVTEVAHNVTTAINQLPRKVLAARPGFPIVNFRSS